MNICKALTTGRPICIHTKVFHVTPSISIISFKNSMQPWIGHWHLRLQGAGAPWLPHSDRILLLPPGAGGELWIRQAGHLGSGQHHQYSQGKVQQNCKSLVIDHWVRGWGLNTFLGFNIFFSGYYFLSKIHFEWHIEIQKLYIKMAIVKMWGLVTWPPYSLYFVAIFSFF